MGQVQQAETAADIGRDSKQVNNKGTVKSFCMVIGCRVAVQRQQSVAAIAGGDDDDVGETLVSLLLYI